MDTHEDRWLCAFREWSSSGAASQFPSRQEEQDAERAFRAGWFAGEQILREILLKPEAKDFSDA